MLLLYISKKRGGIFHFLFLFICFILLNSTGFSQLDTDSSQQYQKIVAGRQYKKSSFHQWLWGKHYRKDWASPVNVKLLNLDTINGGLTAYEQGGGRQSKTLRLRNAQGKEYVLRSIDKSFGKALPEIYRGTFIENIIDDQVSIAEPYSALTIPMMAEAAKIYHTNPQIVFIPSQKGLGEFNKDFANQLYLFEQRPDENWEEAANFGNSNKIVSTEKMLEKISEENDHRVDQLAFVKARLFDMFIGDWGRQEDQWRWAIFEEGDNKIYKPIPRDRDQVYTRLDGVLLSLGISAAGASHLETFDYNIKDVTTYNFPARNLDRRLANEPSKKEWIDIAKELQSSLTDQIIEISIRQLPPEVFPLSGNDIIAKLKSRRDHLMEYASVYYSFLAKEVEIVGSKQNEMFEINILNDTEVEINIYDLKKEGEAKKKPFYLRRFFTNETKEIRIYGLTGNDHYKINDKEKNAIKIRIIGGPDKDVYTNMSPAENKVHVYDNADNNFTNSANIRKHLSRDSAIHAYTYNAFKYDSKGISPSLFYSSQDHFYIGLKYKIEKQQWRKSPFGYQHELAGRYSINEATFSMEYSGLFSQIIGKWNLTLNANYDFIRWNNFYGIGNETKMLTNNRTYHRVRSREFLASAGLNRSFGLHHNLGLSAFYQTIKIINDNGRFLSEQFLDKPGNDQKRFGGARLDYIYQNTDNVIVPSKGIKFTAGIIYAQNLRQGDSAVTRYSSSVNFFIPLSKSFILSVKAGGATLTGKPEFYQWNRLGGSSTLRGFRKYRFYGKTMFYTQNELQFVRNVKSYLFSGKAGLLVFYDAGRIWQPAENSNLWHSGIGGGIILAPFNKVSATIAYGFSKDGKDFSIKLLKSL
jgi:hypothetical protein